MTGKTDKCIAQEVFYAAYNAKIPRQYMNWLTFVA